MNENTTKTVPAELYLDSKELATVRLNSEKIKNAEKDKIILDLKKRILDLQDNLLNSQKEVVKRDRMIMEIQSTTTNNELERIKELSKKELQDLSKHHKELEGKSWGYNPETGEIVINEEFQNPS